MAGFILMRFHESKGRYPFMKPTANKASDSDSDINSTGDSSQGGVLESKAPVQEKTSTIAASQ